jgi:hypothetical protein
MIGPPGYNLDSSILQPSSLRRTQLHAVPGNCPVHSAGSWSKYPGHYLKSQSVEPLQSPPSCPQRRQSPGDTSCPRPELACRIPPALCVKIAFVTSPYQTRHILSSLCHFQKAVLIPLSKSPSVPREVHSSPNQEINRGCPFRSEIGTVPECHTLLLEHQERHTTTKAQQIPSQHLAGSIRAGQAASSTLSRPSSQTRRLPLLGNTTERKPVRSYFHQDIFPYTHAPPVISPP